MTTLPEVPGMQPALSDRTLTLNLNLISPDTVSVRSCEVIGRGYRNRLSFQEHRDLDEVLTGHLALSILACLRKLPQGKHVLSLPEFLVEVPGLLLSGMHVMVMEVKNGVRSAILRFNEFMGAVNNAFLIDIGFQDTGATHAEKLAINVLESICLPVLNQCRNFEELQRGRNRAVSQRLADRAREFEFQTELLKRFIFNAPLSTHDTPQDENTLPRQGGTRFIPD